VYHPSKALRRTANLLLSALLLVGCWTLFQYLSSAPAVYFPPLRVIFRQMATRRSELFMALGVTFARVAQGFVFALAAALPAAFITAKIKWLDDILSPIIDFMRPLPSTAVIPIAIALLGINEQMKISVIAFGCIWPLLLNSYHGFKSVDPILVDLGKTIELSQSAMFAKIALPYALPFIFTGIRISISIALILAVTVEMIASNSGLGFLIMDFERSFRYPEMYASIAFLAISGLALNKILDAIGRVAVFWI
jgi:ABC-type nitrate/sulfonate/bicarbonate transport system permease component